MNRFAAGQLGFRSTARLGFSLIEVLISVLVLGIGLLGLAAVFPVVITQQRDASDVILGGVASEAIRSQILANPEIAGEILSQDGLVDRGEQNLDGDTVPNELPGDDQPTDSDGDGVPDDFDDAYVVGTDEPIFGTGENITSEPGRYNLRTGYSYLWEADWEWGDGALGANARTPDSYLTDYRNDGGMRFRDPLERERAGMPEAVPDLPVGGRLFPRPFSVPGERLDGPQFVWDFVPRRTSTGAVQFAVFVRRIDTGIRVPDGSTLSALLTDEPGGEDGIHAVGVDEDGLPTRNGTGDYAVPLMAPAFPVPSNEYRGSREYNATPRIDVLLDAVRIDVSGSASDTELSTAGAAQIGLLAEVGQQFVDNLGVVREVIEVLDVDGDVVDLRVRPAFSLGSLLPSFGTLAPLNNEEIREAARIGKLRQVVFTPHAPVDVFVMEFNAR